MKKLVTMVLTVAALALVAQASFAANAVRISKVYGGGGGSTGTYIKDFTELFNYSNAPINIGGWALEYGSATGNWGSATTNYFVFPANTIIQPCSYLLIEHGAAGTAGGPLPVPADFSTTNMSAGATSGKMGLFNTLQANVACGAEAPGTLVDKVAWGTATCAEGTAVGALSSTSVGVRNNGGMNDTDSNVADFTITPAVGLVLNNAASGANPLCLSVPAMNRTWGALKSIYR